MKLEKQVTNLKLCEKLKELGVKQESFWSWYCDEESDDTPVLNRSDRAKVVGGVGYFTAKYSAFTVAELGEMLPSEFVDNPKSEHKHYWELKIKLDKNEYYVGYNLWDCSGGILKTIGEDGKTEANARAKMLIYLIENNLIDEIIKQR